MFTLDAVQLEEIFKAGSRMGAKIALVETGAIKSKITKAEAIRRYSRRKVTRWIETGKIKAVKQGGLIMLDVKELELQSSVNELYARHIKPV